MKKSILIAGGTGFLGYHLAKTCILKGWSVTSISTKRPKKIRFLKKVKYLIIDIANKELVEKKIKFNYDYVVNFSGYVNHSEKFKTYQSHYIGCKNLVDFFLDKKIESFIQIGSCVEYGHRKSPQGEDYKTNINDLTSVYSKAKLAATNYLLKKYKEKKFPCTILRLYLVYGPRQDFNRFIPSIIKGCLEDSLFPCSLGNQLRDFLYVDDLINAILKCLKNKSSRGEIINIGSGNPMKIKKIVLLVQNIIKRGKPDFGKIKLRKDEILKLFPKIKKAKKKINWKPRSTFSESIVKTINFYKKII